MKCNLLVFAPCYPEVMYFGESQSRWEAMWELVNEKGEREALHTKRFNNRAEGEEYLMKVFNRKGV